MDDTHGTKKPEYDKIALLGLFALSLLLAYLIVFFKSRLLFSDPIRLSQSGLSVSMPSGHNWYSDKQWKYQENIFTISSLFPRGSDRPTAWANCRYLLSPETSTPQMRFEQMASEIDAVIVETNRTQIDTLTIDWVHIDRPELHFSVFYGTTRLPNDRQLDIELRQITDNPELAQLIFQRIIEGLKFEDNPLLKAGTEIVTEVKSRGLDDFLNNRNQQTYFLIKDEAENNIGFTMDVLVESGIGGSVTGDQPDIRAAGQLYIRGQNSIEHTTSFQCSNNLDKFVYKSETKSETCSRTSRKGAEIVLDGSDVITIRKLQTPPDEQSYQLGPAMIPDVFIDQFLMQMLDSKKDQIIIDIIEANGKIIPILITTIEEAEDMAADEDAAYTFELELLDGRGFSERLYLNDQKQVYKKLVRHDDLYILERTGAENIAREFPEHADRILRDDRMLR